MVWQNLLTALAVGSVMYVVVFVCNQVRERTRRNRNHQPPSFREEPQEHRQHNILCAFCMRGVQVNDPIMVCGHRYHRDCHRNLLPRDRSCTYCLGSNETGAASSAQSSRRSSISNECCYCKIPIQNRQETSRLNCQHLVHKECHESFRNFMQCQACNAEEN